MDSVPHNVTVTEDERANSDPNDAADRPDTDSNIQMSDLPHPGPPLTQHTRRSRSPLRSSEQFLGTGAVDSVPHDRDVTVTRSTYHARNHPHAAKGLLISDLCTRVQHLADTCNNPSLFTSPDLLQKRARGCVETIASLVLCASVKPESFGGLGEQLRKLREIGKICEPLDAGSDGSFLTHWACLYLVVVTRRTLNHSSTSAYARDALKFFSEFRLEDDGNIEDDDLDDDEPTH